MSFECSRLEDVAEVIDSLHKTPSYCAQGFPMVRVTDVKYGNLNLSGCHSVDEGTYLEFSRRFKPKAGDIVITRVGTYGVSARVKEAKFCLGQNTAAIIPKLINPRYLYAALNSEFVRSQIESGVVGSTQKTLSLKHIKALNIPRQGDETEESIAETIGGLDDRISLLRETNATLEAIAQTLFKSWFVDFDPVRAKAEGLEPEGMDAATAALFPDSFEESELGMVPKGWIASTLNDVSDVGIGKTPPRKEAHWFSKSSADIQWVSIRDMGGSSAFLTDTSEYLTTDAVSRFNVRRVPKNTVMLSFKMTIGRVAITSSEMTTNEAIAHFKLTDKSPLTSEYIYLYLRNFDYSTLSSTSSIADAVNSKIVREIPILVPGAGVAAEFQRTVSVIFERIKKVQLQSQSLTSLRDTLLPRLISGRLCLLEAEADTEVVCA